MKEQREPTRPFRRPDSLSRIAAALLLLAWCGVAAAQVESPSPLPGAAPADDRPLEYRLRAGETPAQVAELFRIPLDDLLRRNGVRDASRMAVGTVLRIPDPFAAARQAQRAELARLESAIETRERELARRQDRIERLEAEARDVATERAALQRRVTGYTVVRAVAVVAVGAALGLTIALLIALSRGRDEHRRRVQLVSATDALRDAIERYRSLGAQLELKYQNLYRQSTPAARAGGAASVLLADYERERAPVEIAIRRSEAEIDEALDEAQVA
jgi:hypothetical protein